MAIYLGIVLIYISQSTGWIKSTSMSLNVELLSTLLDFCTSQYPLIGKFLHSLTFLSQQLGLQAILMFWMYRDYQLHFLTSVPIHKFRYVAMSIWKYASSILKLFENKYSISFFQVSLRSFFCISNTCTAQFQLWNCYQLYL